MEKGINKNMKISKYNVMIAVFCFALSCFSGCLTSRQASFYTLHSIEKGSEERTTALAKEGPALLIGPIEIPEYLNRPQIITTPNKNVVNFAEFDHWAEPLKHNITRVIIENISLLLNTNKIFVFPKTSKLPIEYKVDIEIVKLDGKLGENSYLNALWSITDGKTKKVITMDRTNIKEPLNSTDYVSYVSAQSRLLEALCIEITDEITKLMKMNSGKGKSYKDKQ